VSRDVQFFFGLGSRYSYLAATQIENLERDTGCSVTWQPLLSAVLMDRRGQNPFAARDADGNWSGVAVSGQYNEQYRRQDLARWAALYDVLYQEPPEPQMPAARRTLYCVAAAHAGVGAAYARAMFASIYAAGVATTEAECLRLAESVGADGNRLRDMVDSGAAAHGHEEIIALGLKYHVFGVPSFVVDGAVFWGNDRLVLLRHHLKRS
jgi:2-hydroxychromene-2-carboxylate isomerase